MERNIEDSGYLNYLGTNIRRKQYQVWKDKMLAQIDDVAKSFREVGLNETMEKFRLSVRDVVLLKRLNYFNEDEIPSELEQLDRVTKL